jgi:hypothetical protein
MHIKMNVLFYHSEISFRLFCFFLVHIITYNVYRYLSIYKCFHRAPGIYTPTTSEHNMGYMYTRNVLLNIHHPEKTPFNPIQSPPKKKEA